VDTLKTCPNTGGQKKLEEVFFMIVTAAARSSAESLTVCLRPSFATRYTAALGNNVLLQGFAMKVWLSAGLGLLELGGAEGDCEAGLASDAGLAELAGFSELRGEVGDS